MPTLTASSSAVFTSVGLNASTIYGIFVALIGTAVDFGLWLVQVTWPFLLAVAFIFLMWRIAHKFMGIGRQGH
jgi:hypothetical protein